MKRAIPILLLLWALPARAGGGGEGGRQVEYVGGTVISDAQHGVLRTTDAQFFEFRGKRETPIRLDYGRINLVEYGQKVDRRYVAAVLVSPMFLLAKKRAHFLTVGYTDDEGRQQAMVFRVDKKDIRSLLVSLEARTGRKVQYQDEEARKAGKG